MVEDLGFYSYQRKKTAVSILKVRKFKHSFPKNASLCGRGWADVEAEASFVACLGKWKRSDETSNASIRG
jgi:hypothetical protein